MIPVRLERDRQVNRRSDRFIEAVFIVVNLQERRPASHQAPHDCGSLRRHTVSCSQSLGLCGLFSQVAAPQRMDSTQQPRPRFPPAARATALALLLRSLLQRLPDGMAKTAPGLSEFCSCAGLRVGTLVTPPSKPPNHPTSRLLTSIIYHTFLKTKRVTAYGYTLFTVQG